ncbi:MAG: DUF1828 domain-containing protein [Candidatus Gastranaerophilales bacterium]|nr:DUF1828 domain-containing protein [Candidatus Gastranaerophilales bacterium]
MITIDDVKKYINTEIKIKEKRPNIYQIIAPFFHEDGDMVEMFLEVNQNNMLRFCDYGLTVMKLSYYLEELSKTNQRVYNEILKENSLDQENGNIFLDTDLDNLNTDFLHFAETLSKISSLKYFDSHRQKSIFYDVLSELISDSFKDINVKKDFVPIKEYPENKVDYAFEGKERSLYLFGVKDNNKALDVVASCLEFKQKGSKAQSVVVYDDFSKMNLSTRTLARLLRNTDKQFMDLTQFKEEGQNYISGMIA